MKTKKDIIKYLKEAEEVVEKHEENEDYDNPYLEDVAIMDTLRWILG